LLINHSNTDPSKPEYFSHTFPQSASTPRNHHHLLSLIIIHFARGTIGREASGYEDKDVVQGEKEEVGRGKQEGRVGIGGSEGAQGEREKESNEGVEEGLTEDGEEEIEGQMVLPGG
ncbi:hypothetical protein MMC31_003793, partial [Peltigera leucophlebia]|nr:hypothetical protein [Peltigera leucophlebia]